jgi:Zn-dependent protease
MSWHDRDNPTAGDGPPGMGGPGGDWRNVRPTLDNPLTWSIPLGRWFGVVMRIHVLFLLYVVIQLLRASGSQELSDTKTPWLDIAGASMGALFVVVLLHECGHVVASRLVGGRADEMLLWPLGGLAFAQLPRYWLAHLIAAAGGPVVNLSICAFLTLLLGVASEWRWWGIAIPNPLDPFAAIEEKGISESWLMMSLYLTNTVSYILLWFNLLPMFPLDGGRMMQACLWSRLGYARSMRAAVRVGYFVALLLVVFAAVQRLWPVLGVAGLGLAVCYATHRQFQFTEQVMGVDEYAYSVSPRVGQAERALRPTWSQRRARRRAAQQRADAVELDRILQKIVDQGMGSLSGAERKLLKRATDQRRSRGGDGG